ncbi:MAG: response regulator [Allosphingosinicella sp.]|uniref:response regulator n=1 Tax=Allosphingosinicella sp. TaxID=2823234 RepID=UPI00392394DA
MIQPPHREVVLVLLVDDEPLILASAQDALEEGGYAIAAVDNGSDAVAFIDARVGELSCLVTDIRLGAGPDGWTVAHHARERKPDLPVVYMTGDSSHEWHSKGVPDSLILQKPYASAQLVSAVSSLIVAADSR